METDCTHIPYGATGFFSGLVNDYTNNNTALSDFYQYKPSREGVEAAIRDRQRFAVDRKTLVQVLRRQYEGLPAHDAVTANIAALLDDDTYTICTAHQPNLLTGYLYFFYKIMHAIKMADELNAQHPDKRFVPVYYMGSEDNDLEELGQFWYEGHLYRWDADGQGGAVGRMKTDSVKPLLDELYRHIGPPGRHYDALKELLDESYRKHKTIADATAHLVHTLFGRFGLVVLNPDDAELKKRFLPVMEDDLLRHTALPIVQAQSESLSLEYKAQAFPRAINLFYLNDGIRERIEERNGEYIVRNTGLRFTTEEIKAELQQYPERFSPNVILRGLFQETILPDICFIGGGAELAYWLQLKPLFEQYRVFFPVIYLRQSVQIIRPEALKLMEKSGLMQQDVFRTKESLVRQAITDKQGVTWTTDRERDQIAAILKDLQVKAKHIDPTLEAAAAALVARMRRQLGSLEQKMYRAEKRKEQVLNDRLDRLKALLFPGGALQERKENFITYYLQDGFHIFEQILDAIKPFDQEFLIASLKERD